MKRDLKIETLVAELISCGFKTYTLSDNEVVRNHLRFMVNTYTYSLFKLNLENASNINL